MIRFEGFEAGFYEDMASVERTITRIATDHDFLIKSLVFNGLTDNELLNINRTHLGHDTYTDIITFDYSRKKKLMGEVFISLDRIKENSLSLSAPFSLELKRIIFHGVLHLVGYKDKSAADKLEMTSKEDYYLSLHP